MVFIKDLQKSYDIGKSKLHVLKGINLDISEGEFVSIMGSSGSGKSTLLNIIGILDQKDSGIYELDGIPIEHLNEAKAAEYRSKFLGFVFQSFNLISYKTALENVALPLYYQNVSRKERNQRALDYLEKVGLADWANRLPNELSGGQKRRVAIAGVIAMEPEILILDEPTAGLDPGAHKEILRMIEKIHSAQKNIIIFVSHNMSDVAEMADRVLVMDEGKILMMDTPEVVFSRHEELNAIGLDIPPVTELMNDIGACGVNVPANVLNIEDAKTALLAYLKNKNAGVDSSKPERGESND